MSSSNKIATVTGAAGFVASMLVEQLLKKGYTVHGTVRSLKDQSKLQSFLDAFSSQLASKQLQLFEADLGASGSFSTAIKGSHIVFHTASPFFLGKTSDPQRDFIDPALNGTANVLNSAFAEPSVRKIIVTSSTAAIRDFVPEGQKARFTEKDWNKSATIEKAPYPLSKVLAEKKAWELFEEHKKAGGNKVLLVVNPSWIIGPPVHIRSANDAESLQTLLAKYLDGSYLAAGAPTLRFNIVDVRDIANVQIRLAEKDTAEGRYISAHPDSYDGLDWAKVLEKVYPQSTDKLPKKLVEGAPKQGISEVDNSKVLKELEGIKFIPIEQSIKDTVEQLKKFGLINTL